MLACHYGHEDTALTILQTSSSIHAHDAQGRNVLHWCAYSGLSKVLIEILNQTKACSLPLLLHELDHDMKWSPLGTAVMYNQQRVAQVLLQAGVIPGEQDQALARRLSHGQVFITLFEDRIRSATRRDVEGFSFSGSLVSVGP